MTCKNEYQRVVFAGFGRDDSLPLTQVRWGRRHDPSLAVLSKGLELRRWRENLELKTQFKGGLSECEFTLHLVVGRESALYAWSVNGTG